METLEENPIAQGENSTQANNLSALQTGTPKTNESARVKKIITAGPAQSINWELLKLLFIIGAIVSGSIICIIFFLSCKKDATSKKQPSQHPKTVAIAKNKLQP